MQIHQLQVEGKRTRKRVGRGGKRGTYSGRGMKGQKSRSGGNVDPLFEGGRSSLIHRMKKLRGFKSPHAKLVVVRLSDLEQLFDAGSEVSIVTLAKKGHIRQNELRNGAKIVASGTLTKKMMIAKDINVSVAAAKVIEKTGGTIAKQEAQSLTSDVSGKKEKEVPKKR